MSTPRLDQKGFIHQQGTLEKIVGSFAMDAVPSVAAVNLLGTGYTVAIVAGNGTYDIVLDDAAFRIISARACIQTISAANIDMYAQVESVTGGIGGTAAVRVKCMTGAVETDLPVTDRIHFELTVYGVSVDA